MIIIPGQMTPFHPVATEVATTANSAKLARSTVRPETCRCFEISSRLSPARGQLYSSFVILQVKLLFIVFTVQVVQKIISLGLVSCCLLHQMRRIKDGTILVYMLLHPDGWYGEVA